LEQQLKDDKTITMDELLVKLKTKYPDLKLPRVHFATYFAAFTLALVAHQSPIE